MRTEDIYRFLEKEDLSTYSRKLVKNPDYPIYGVRIPALKRIAKTLEDSDIEYVFHEDVILKGIVIAGKNIPFSEKKSLILSYLKDLSSWDETDTFASLLKVKKSEIKDAFAFFYSLLEKKEVYTRRLAIVWLKNNMRKAEDAGFLINRIARVADDDYYIAMAKAWALCDAFIYYPSLARQYVHLLTTREKAMLKGKIRDSYRIFDNLEI